MTPLITFLVVFSPDQTWAKHSVYPSQIECGEVLPRVELPTPDWHSACVSTLLPSVSIRPKART